MAHHLPASKTEYLFPRLETLGTGGQWSVCRAGLVWDTRHCGCRDLPGLVPPKPPVAPLFLSIPSAKKTLDIVTGTQGGDLDQPQPCPSSPHLTFEGSTKESGEIF